MKSNFISKDKFQFREIEFELSTIESWGEGVNKIYAFSEKIGDTVLFYEVDGKIYWVCDDSLFDVIIGNDNIDEGSVLEDIIRDRETELKYCEINGFNSFGETMEGFVTNPIHHKIVDFKDGNPSNCSVDNLFIRE